MIKLYALRSAPEFIIPLTFFAPTFIMIFLISTIDIFYYYDQLQAPVTTITHSARSPKFYFKIPINSSIPVTPAPINTAEASVAEKLGYTSLGASCVIVLFFLIRYFVG